MSPNPPPKALAQDQKRSLLHLLSYLSDPTICPSSSSPSDSSASAADIFRSIHVDTYDGDTPNTPSIRRAIRERASVIFTNPDMLHVSILPQHRLWREFLTQLRFVIVDELHYYTGTLGSHVAMVMRRLRRVCSMYDNHHVQFVSCSATIANPVELMSNLFNLPPPSIALTSSSSDTSPRGPKHHIIWNPPPKNIHDLREGRLSLLEEAVKVVAHI
ncbi:hypothetical protein HK102_012603, partial [Quaeritorhiza haematococci]